MPTADRITIYLSRNYSDLLSARALRAGSSLSRYVADLIVQHLAQETVLARKAETEWLGPAPGARPREERLGKLLVEEPSVEDVLGPIGAFKPAVRPPLPAGGDEGTGVDGSGVGGALVSNPTPPRVGFDFPNGFSDPDPDAI